MRVLIIEDNPDIVANLYAYLEPLGYALDCEHRGDAGLAAAARGSHDAIILDLMLPGLDGVELGGSTLSPVLSSGDSSRGTVPSLRHTSTRTWVNSTPPRRANANSRLV